MNIQLAALALRFLFIAVSTFLAIVVWARVRDIAWMLLVIGVIAAYGDVMYDLLLQFGFLPEPSDNELYASILSFVLPNLPWAFFSAAFIAMILKRRRPAKRKTRL